MQPRAIAVPELKVKEFAEAVTVIEADVAFFSEVVREHPVVPRMVVVSALQRYVQLAAERLAGGLTVKVFGLVKEVVGIQNGPFLVVHEYFGEETHRSLGLVYFGSPKFTASH